MPSLQRAGGFEPLELSAAELLASFGYHEEFNPPPVLSVEDELAEMERDSAAFAFQMSRG